jgi:hypothetical protein
MFGRRRGQGAMEYLMTYGWAILVVMIVGLAMWRLGIFSMGSTSLTTTGFGKLKPQLAGTGLTSAGVFNGIFTNGAGTGITITSFTINNTITGVACSTTTTLAGFGPVSTGGNFLITGSGCGSGKAGDSYIIDVKIGYDVNVGGTITSHTESGSIRGPLE